ncbi:hypothetical protein [Helicobacter sp. T3_23-1059]
MAKIVNTFALYERLKTQKQHKLTRRFYKKTAYPKSTPPPQKKPKS